MPGPTPAARSAALAVLGLSDQASHRDVTRAYRRLAKTTHPDVTGPLDHDAGRRFAALTEAYHLLTGMPATPIVRTAPPASRPVTVSVRLTPPPPFVAGPVRVTPTARTPRRPA